MIRTKLCAFAAGVLVLSAVAPCQADLFATITATNQILRIDPVTGAVTRTYEIPSLPMNGASTNGLAFDGHVLYASHRINATDALFQFDVVNEFWLPPTPLILVNPSGVLQPVTGLGYRAEEFGGSLIAVTRNPADAPPSYIYQYQVGPGFPNPFEPLIPFSPVGELPPSMDAFGVDVDPVSGDLWISVEEVVGTTRTPRLLRTDLTGAVLQTLTPALPPVTLIRGVGFDGGSMFIAGRNLPSQTNSVYEIDRTTGAGLRSFALSAGPGVGALTGGTVFAVPEPSTILMAAVAVAGFGAMRRRERKDADVILIASNRMN